MPTILNMHTDHTLGSSVISKNSFQVLDKFQMLTAANKAIHLDQNDKKITKNIHSEVVFQLSGTRSVSIPSQVSQQGTLCLPQSELFTDVVLVTYK